MSERSVVTRAPNSPAAIGPYSQAVVDGQFVYTSGVIGVDPESGALDAGGIEGQTRRALGNLRAVLDAAGAAFADVVKTTVFLIDMDDFPALNAVYGEAFAGGTPPARSTVAVAALPRGARVEIEAVAIVG